MAGLLADLRCFTAPVSEGLLLFDLEDRVVRGLEFTSACGAISGTAAVSSAFWRVFFEVLLNCMQDIKAHQNIFCSFCFGLLSQLRAGQGRAGSCDAAHISGFTGVELPGAGENLRI